jgi:hypothetical protein
LVIAHLPAIPSPKATSLIKKLVNAADEILPPEFLIKISKDRDDSDMGKTIPSFAQVFDKIQNSFSKFRRALLAPDQIIVDSLFALARKHLASGGLATRPLPFETILFCMLIEQYKEIKKLEENIKMHETTRK